MTTNTRDTPADDDGSPLPSKKTVSQKTDDTLAVAISMKNNQ
jgi:hypothetical protein